MRKIKKISLVIVMMILVSMVTPSVLPVVNAATKASVKISKTKITLTVGKYTTLKIKGTNKKVKWTVKNKKVATVNSKGKIVAKKKGTTTVTATVNKKKYSCKISVNKEYTGKVKGIVKYDDVKLDTGSYIAIIPQNELLLVKDNSDFSNLLANKKTNGIITVAVDINGKYEIKNVPVGRYVMVIVSKNKISDFRLEYETDPAMGNWSSTIDNYLSEYINQSDVDLFKENIGYNSIKFKNITIKKNYVKTYNFSF